ncbi:50S ribosomal protein L33 [Candidatus Aerophobetes bacterium]|uniref:Large ribosomal subunit protein bL33 n=1 Tax=Aerophobetes bacterium TaxID=2030807 RepID=A0A662DGX1_UNCAE|nr:50S ribosomal protein L33 [Candidatus Aerophobetes bacterium]RLE14745.1 MAG: 50S ribosomal protein L33 [Candidatus Aerophobetes bacterium]HDN84763.1 50S ribosomal protein L33 [Candidatus Aerophobetes bacterium]
MAQIVTLVCSECKARNYTTTRSKKTSSLALKKYCKFCHKHTLHKEK